MASASPAHVVIFPFMAFGHTLPLLDLSKVLSRLDVKVTIITTPSNVSSILPYIKNYPKIHLKEIPFPIVEDLPKGCENTKDLSSMDQLLPFLMATSQLQQPFEEILREMADVLETLPICVISDFFLGWTLATCRLFGVPRLSFHGMGVLSSTICKTIFVHAPHLKVESDSEPLSLPGLTLPFMLTRGELPGELRDTNHDHPLSRFLSVVGENEADSWGIIMNSYVELEGEHVVAQEAFYGENRTRAWCVGPISLYSECGSQQQKPSDEPYTMWLNERNRSGSVIYVSFGTQAHVSDMQLDEVALGLEMSGHPFMLVIRSKTWAPPDGLEERVKDKGLIVRNWVDQRRILSHSATGGFLSHCGWNSVLESLSAGVPLLAWPLMAEQPFNAKFVVEGLKAGLWVPVGPQKSGDEIVTVGKEEICDGVRELMGGEKGREARERAEALGLTAREAVEKDGSSHKTLRDLIDSLSHLKCNGVTAK